ncbi:conserved hypothetical protein [Pseudomonas veronii]|uniref:hypothetical protein n=1 Tax=Pseudomonas veronii TaxID=76761 RepID=UPI00175BF27B|nr:hypothetical protein [Pseudomonas veronii]CAD0266056.1 conserved hypothetical protein [Pseudomonas veronii]
MNDSEFEIAARRAQGPIALHFAVLPHSPTNSVLLNENGHPVLTNYSDVDWKGLAISARDAIDGVVPKSVKLYVADDAIDTMDVLNISMDTGRPFEGVAGFGSRLNSTFSRVSMQDMRAGITKLAGHSADLHINTPIQGKRPPLGALILSLKFTGGLQVVDYLHEATDTLFGTPSIAITYEGFKPQPTTGEMPSFLAEWLRSQFGVVYGAACTTVAIGRTFAD